MLGILRMSLQCLQHSINPFYLRKYFLCQIQKILFFSKYTNTNSQVCRAVFNNVRIRDLNILWLI